MLAHFSATLAGQMTEGLLPKTAMFRTTYFNLGAVSGVVHVGIVILLVMHRIGFMYKDFKCQHTCHVASYPT